jgi:hypothetical protein
VIGGTGRPVHYFGDFSFIKTSAGPVAIDTGYSPNRVPAAMADLG